MKIALCHLEISRGPEHKNIELLENAVRIAADNGAKWVVTPETAVQGYYFYKLVYFCFWDAANMMMV